MARSKPEKPMPRMYATLIERPADCTCTWAWDNQVKSFLLKYRNATCPVVSWHMRLERVRLSRG